MEGADKQMVLDNGWDCCDTDLVDTRKVVFVKWSTNGGAELENLEVVV